MQVQKINNDLSFGYNKELNKQLVRNLKLDKQNDLYRTFLKVNDLANETEELLRKNEKKLFGTEFFADLETTFLRLKASLCEAINSYFPKLNYSKIEIGTYEKEVSNLDIPAEEPHWLKDTVEVLKEQDEQTDQQVVAEKIMQLAYGGELSEAEPASQIPEAAEEVEDAVKKGASLVKEYIPTESAKRGFESLGGMFELKKTLNERVVGMLKNPQQARLDEIEYGKKMPKGILLYGPPGCGKTTVVEHLSTEADVPLFKLETGSLGSPYIHEMSQNIDAAFDYAESKATPDKPALIFIDDADALFGARRSGESDDHHLEELGTFLNRIQKAGEKNVVVLAATNRYDMMDEAVRSRFEEQIYVGLPDKEARKSVLSLFLNSRTKGKNLASNDAEMDELAQKFDKFPIRAMKMITDKASIEALTDGRRNITLKDFEKIISESQNMKVKEDNYKTNVERRTSGFSL